MRCASLRCVVHDSAATHCDVRVFGVLLIKYRMDSAKHHDFANGLRFPFARVRTFLCLCKFVQPSFSIRPSQARWADLRIQSLVVVHAQCLFCGGLLQSLRANMVRRFRPTIVTWLSWLLLLLARRLQKKGPLFAHLEFEILLSALLCTFRIADAAAPIFLLALVIWCLFLPREIQLVSWDHRAFTSTRCRLMSGPCHF